jgi:hypothetical protein
MSAYIVEDHTINRIVTFVLNDHGRRSMAFHWQRAGYDIVNDPEAAERLAVDLHLMNCDAVDTRYSKGTAAHDVQVCFQFKRAHCPSTVDPRFQIYKHAKCLRYQCTEGDVTERPLYLALEKFIAQLADCIIESLPQSSDAKWE